MPQALQTLRIDRAAVSTAEKEIETRWAGDSSRSFPVARNKFTVQIGEQTITLQPDGTGLSVLPEGILLVKNVASLRQREYPGRHFEI